MSAREKLAFRDPRIETRRVNNEVRETFFGEKISSVDKKIFPQAKTFFEEKNFQEENKIFFGRKYFFRVADIFFL